MNDTQVQSYSIKGFFILFSGQSISLLGSQIVQFALVWWLVQETHSATVLSIAAIFGFLPQVVLGPIIGTLVDRWNRRQVMLLSDSIIALATLVLAWIFTIGSVQIWMVYLIMFIRALGEGFQKPAMMASIPLMIPDKYLSNIHGLRQAFYGGLQIISAPLAALLLGLIPTVAILLIDVITALFAITPLLFIIIPQPDKNQDRSGIGNIQSVWADMIAGFKYVRSLEGLFILIAFMSLIGVLLMPPFILLPLLVTNHFGGDVIDLGWILSATGIGEVIGGITLSLWGGFKKRIITVMTGLIGIGLSLIIVSVLPPAYFLFAISAMFLGGFMSSIINGSQVAIIQACSTPEMQGRVWTITGSMMNCTTPLGLLIAGPVADLMGIKFWYIVGGIGSVIIGITLMLIPAVIHIEEGRAKVS